jgi:uncharacterized radical SAM superfamily Fe-S cluster-containing enzyme
MLSGGEPTIHPQIAETLDRLAALPVTRILLNTNGIRLTNEDAFLEKIAAHKERVEVYLQYDGQRRSTHERLRGADLTELKARAIARLSQARVFTTLAMTVDKENADQIGEVLDTAFATPYVGGVMYQPLFASGRAPQLDPMDRITTTGVLARIEAQSRNAVKARDLIALPCSHPDCCSIGYFIKGKNGGYSGLASIVGEDALRENLSLFGNTISFSESLSAVRTALFGIMSETMTLSRPQLLDHLRVLCGACDLSFTQRFVGERVKRVTVKHFMDADTLIAERLEQCCVHVAGAGNDPVRMPFCAARLFPKVRARALEGAVSRAANRNVPQS